MIVFCDRKTCKHIRGSIYGGMSCGQQHSVTLNSMGKCKDWERREKGKKPPMPNFTIATKDQK